MIFFKSCSFLSAIFCILFFAFVLIPLPAQEAILFSYERNFIRASLPAKADILNDAAKDERSVEFIGDLYEFALQFALTNGRFLRDDPDMIVLVGTAARGAGSGGNRSSVNSLWELFGIFNDSYTRAEILGALGVLGKGNARVITNLNQFLQDQNRNFRAGISIDHPVLLACIQALGLLGDESSFPVLFSAMTAAYPQAIIQETLKALEAIQGNYMDYLIEVIQNNPFAEKAAAFRIGAYNERFSLAERGELARIALQVSLEANTPAGPSGSSGPVEASLRYDAITMLTRLRWSPASYLAVRNFHRVQEDFINGAAPKERLLEAIACLGVMNSSEAAQALALQLGYFNSLTERTGEYDEAVILALVNALGELGDKAAFDYLLYISFLNYPDRIQAAAREALNRLQW